MVRDRLYFMETKTEKGVREGRGAEGGLNIETGRGIGRTGGGEGEETRKSPKAVTGGAKSTLMNDITRTQEL